MAIRTDDLLQCQSIMRRHGVSYSFATRFFPRKVREATAVLYAFFRVPDDIVDAGASQADARRDLEAWMDKWRRTEHEDVGDAVLRAAAEVFRIYGIPRKLGDDFLQAMVQDVTVDRYHTYADLERYMYGSAAVVGIMMCYVIGYKDAGTLERARALGEAMQLTNFLRDIKDDYITRGRIYLPQEDMRRFDLGDDDIARGVLTPALRDLIRFEVARARELYAFAEGGIDELDRSGQFAVRLASRLYAAILSKIEEHEYDVFSGRVRTSYLEKVRIMLKLCLNKNSGRL